MHSEWKVTRNNFGDGDMFAVYRLRDVAAVHHSGNMELATEYMEDRQEAAAIADKLNGAAEGEI